MSWEQLNKTHSHLTLESICVALETYEQESPETQQHDIIIVWRKTCNAYEVSTERSSKKKKKMELSNKL